MGLDSYLYVMGLTKLFIVIWQDAIGICNVYIYSLANNNYTIRNQFFFSLEFASTTNFIYMGILFFSLKFSTFHFSFHLLLSYRSWRMSIWRRSMPSTNKKRRYCLFQPNWWHRRKSMILFKLDFSFFLVYFTCLGYKWKIVGKLGISCMPLSGSQAWDL